MSMKWPSLAGAVAPAARRWARTLGDAALPLACPLCESPLRATEAPTGLCACCRRALPGRAAPRCPGCALRAAAVAPACADCRARPASFSAARAVCDYAPPVDRLLQAFKFGGQIGLARALGAAMAGRARPFVAPAGLVVPVPLGPRRLASRGYNQAALLARVVGARLGVEVLASMLERIGDQEPQSGKSRTERLNALAGAFRCRRPLAPRPVILIDDVMTTGATCDAAARALRAAGASTVVALVFARTP